MTENLTTPENIEKAVDFIRLKIDFPLQAGVILGSGQSEVLNEMESPVEIPYKQIPFFPRSTVEGHKGSLTIGFLEGVAVAVMQGRVHGYEGHHPANLGFPVRVLSELGIESLLLTNSAGAVNESYKPGDLIIIRDHLNLMGFNPLTGPHHQQWGPRFVDLTHAYDRSLREYAKEVITESTGTYKEGVYAAMAGPTYETPAEVRMLRVLGADLAGMSTVTEVIVARQSGMRVMAISLVTNMGAGILNEELTHAEVTETAHKALPRLRSLITGVLKKIDLE